MDDGFQPLSAGLQETLCRVAKTAGMAQALQPVFRQQTAAMAQAMSKLTPVLASHSKMAQQMAAVSATSKLNWATQLPVWRLPIDEYLRQITESISWLATASPTLPRFDFPSLAALEAVLDLPVEAAVEESETAEKARTLTPWLVALVLATALACTGDEQARLAVLSDLQAARVLLDASPVIQREPDVAGALTIFAVYSLLRFFMDLLRRQR